MEGNACRVGFDRKEDAVWALIGCVLKSCARIAAVPLQDVLMLDDTARMNVPGVAAGNWTWQAEHDQVVASVDTLKDLAEKSDRAR